MENASEALYMAFAMMIFALALTLAFTSFSSLRATASSIIQRDEIIDLATTDDGNYIYYIKGTDKLDRTVGIETIISSMYRAYKENYKIVIIFKDPTYNIDLKSIETSDGKKHYFIDLKEENLSSQLKARAQLDDKLSKGLYNKLKGKKFIEKLGQYYIEDEGDDSSPAIEDEVLDVNKTLKRVITYIEE